MRARNGRASLGAPPPLPLLHSLLLFLLFLALASCCCLPLSVEAAGGSLFVGEDSFLMDAPLQVQGIDVVASLRLLQAALDGVSTQLSDVKAALDNTTAKLANVSARLASAETIIADLEAQNVLLRTRASNVEDLVAGSSEAVSLVLGLQHSNVSTNARIDSTDASVADLNTRASNLENLAPDSSTAVVRVLGLQNSNASTNARVDALLADLSNVEHLVADSSPAVNLLLELQSSNFSTNARVTSLDFSVGNLAARATRMETLAPASSAAVDLVLGLQSSNASMNARVSSLGSSLLAVETLVPSSSAAVDLVLGLQSSNVSTNTRVAALAGGLSDLRALIPGSSAAVDLLMGLQSSNASTNTRVDQLTASTSVSLADLSTRMGAAERLEGGTPLVQAVNASTVATAHLLYSSTPGFKNRLPNADFLRDSQYSFSAIPIVHDLQRVQDGWFTASSAAALPGVFVLQTNGGAASGVKAPLAGVNWLAVNTTRNVSSPLPTDYFGVRARMPMSAIADFGWGSAAAAPATLSFRVRCSAAPVAFGGSIRDGAPGRSFTFNYSIPTANEWHRIAIAISADFAGAWVNNAASGWGINVDFTLMDGGQYATNAADSFSWLVANRITPQGSANLAAAAGQSWMIAAPQLEKGSVATAFDVRNPELSAIVSNLASQSPAFKNRLVNGDFSSDFAGISTPAGTFVNVSSSPSAVADGWSLLWSAPVSPQWQLARNLGGVAPPAGFSSFIGVRAAYTNASVDPLQFALLQQTLPYSSVADFLLGTPSSMPLTLSFRAMAKVAGTYSGSIRSATAQRCFLFAYVITAPNVWQTVSVTTLPDISAASWLQGSAVPPSAPAMLLSFALQGGSDGSVSVTANNALSLWRPNSWSVLAGSVDLGATAGATLYLTGVQLEKGSLPTAFDLRGWSSDLASLRASTPGRVNRLRNAAFALDTTHGGALTPILVDGQRIIDDWIVGGTGNCTSGYFAFQQSLMGLTPPPGFSSYLGFVGLGDSSWVPLSVPGSTENFHFQQRLTLTDFADFGWGTPAAAPITISFWARASQTGQRSVVLRNSALNRCNAQTYFIAAADRWQFITLTFPGETTGAWIQSPSTGIAMYVMLILSDGEGATSTLAENGLWVNRNVRSVVGSVRLGAGHHFLITGIQLERGSTATAFDVASLNPPASQAALLAASSAWRNRMANGDAAVDTLNRGAIVAVPPSNYSAVDVMEGWRVVANSSVAWEAQQNLEGVAPPAEFNSYIGVRAAPNTDTNTTVDAAQYALLEQVLSYSSIQDFLWSTPTALPATLSFWVRCSVVGVGSVSLRTAGPISRSFVSLFVVGAANTWQRTTVAVLPITASGFVQGAPTTPALRVAFALQAGSMLQLGSAMAFVWNAAKFVSHASVVNLAATAGATLMITGVQLEKGSAASAYDVRPFQTELVPSGTAALVASSAASVANLRLQTPGNVNRLRNPAFALEPQHGGALVPILTDGQRLMEGAWVFGCPNNCSLNNFAFQQNMLNAAAPPGFSSYLGVNATSGWLPTPGSADQFFLQQRMSLAQMSDLAWGTPAAVPVTLSFWARSSLAERWSVVLRNAQTNRCIGQQYTIAAPDVWQFVMLTFPGETGGLWTVSPSTGLALYIMFVLGDSQGAPYSQSEVGQWVPRNVRGIQGNAQLTKGNNWMVTGVQFERGSAATAFDVSSLHPSAPQSGVSATTGAWKNRIVNGDASVDTINRGALVTVAASLPVQSTVDVLDGWRISTNSSVGWEAQQNLGGIAPPAGFSSYIGVRPTGVSASATADVSEFAMLEQVVSSAAIADFLWGTTDAIYAMLSFYVRVSVAGLYTTTVSDVAQSGKFTHTSPFVVSASTTNTWQLVTAQIMPSRTGTWSRSAASAPALLVSFALQAGSALHVKGPGWVWAANDFTFSHGNAVNMAAVAGATFMVTALQLEKGSVATAFDARPYGTELVPLGSSASVRTELANVRQSTPGFVNRLRNGAFNVDLHYRGESIPILVDNNQRIHAGWHIGCTNDCSSQAHFAYQENLDGIAPPPGFSKFVGIRGVTPGGWAAASGSSDILHLTQLVSLENFADFAWGTAAATPATLSFWVRTSQPGNWSCTVRNAGLSRCIGLSYNVAVANVWQFVSLRIPGETSGSWAQGGSGFAMYLMFTLSDGEEFVYTPAQAAAGQWVTHNVRSVSGSNKLGAGQSWMVTGVQLERGSMATAFDVGSASSSVAAPQSALSALTPAWRNRMANGDMALDSVSRGGLVTVPASASNPGVATSVDVIDGWRLVSNHSVGWQAQQNLGGITPPAGFSSYIGVRATSVNAIVDPEQFALLEQPVPFASLSDFLWGTSDAIGASVSFWVRSSVVGLHSVNVRDVAAGGRWSFTAPFVLPTANAWQWISVPVLPPRTGLWMQSPASLPSLRVSFALQTGQNLWVPKNGGNGWSINTSALGHSNAINLAATAGASLYITGVQLEKGSVASTYDARSWSVDSVPAGTISSLLGATPANKNRLTNGAFAADSTNLGAAAPCLLSNQPVMDGWMAFGNAPAGTFTVQQSMGASSATGTLLPPPGFTAFLGVNVTAPAPISSPASNVYFRINQIVPFGAMSDLAYGTAGALPTTLSFWVRSSMTGTWGGSWRNFVRGKSFVFSYTLAAPLVWEFKSFVIPGETSADGSWAAISAATNFGWLEFTLLTGADYETEHTGRWISVNRIAPLGTNNIASRVGATWHLAGVQLERGSMATAFDHKSYDLSQTLSSLATGTPATRNRLANGDFALDSIRHTMPYTTTNNAGAPAAGPDNWYILVNLGPASGWSVQQDMVAPPPGFSHSVGIRALVASPDPIAASQYAMLQQFLPWGKLQDLAWGSSAAVNLTLSFRARASVSGVFGGSLRMTSQARSHPFSYVISAPDIWFSFSVPILADVFGNWSAPLGPFSGGTPDADAAKLVFAVQAGTARSGVWGYWHPSDLYTVNPNTNLAAAVGNSWHITGVQLERGTVATAFDWQPWVAQPQ
jgi:hypothetical protein